MGELVAGYDAVLFDLDGVVYLGPLAVGAAPAAIAALRSSGQRIGFVTNNAARSPQAVADHLTEMGVPASEDDVITSSQAGVRLLSDYLSPGEQVLVVGTAALAEQVHLAGFRPVRSAAEEPAAVIQGYDPNLAWPLVEEAAIAIHRGARWIATNTDLTRPTDRGILPGNGAAVAALRFAVDIDPVVAGKPCAPLMLTAIARARASSPLFVGDRIDTDIAGATGVGMDSALVLTGAHGKRDLIQAGPDGRPTWLIADLSELHAPARTAEVADGVAQCNGQRARVRDGGIVLGSRPGSPSEECDALWAITQLAWAAADQDRNVDCDAALAALPEIS